MMGGKERRDVDKGGKIILPPSALDHLTRLHIQFPMLFKLSNKTKNRVTHCGVLEFVAEEGRCYLPYWMMKNLLLKEGDIIEVKYVNLEIAKFAKFQPQSVDFLEISNPKAVLENSLRNFATLTKGDVVSINYNDKDFELCILETRPGDAVSIIECDMDVDFAAPVGYQEPTREDYMKAKQGETKNLYGDKNLFQKKDEKKAAANEGYRLDGKAKKPSRNHTTSTSSQSGDQVMNESTSKDKNKDIQEEEKQIGIPYLDYPVGLIRFNRDFSRYETAKEPEEGEEKPQVKGYKLKNIGAK
jgi:ubiquitin fusion degradation protein 1